ncbi:MAG: ABC transporter permease subunit [Meiothermus sp.]|jgi:iron(III) transport system permease protein|uniref:ABC transporter permease n=1 Tax=Meiothermus sp. TaxID=1955249 RepID=UPI0028CC25F0|nr:ABC transporter permease subunit [Meiothermus sp.]MDT7919499.1 ABC transporter permease subunit [Meiothermus sp.]
MNPRPTLSAFWLLLSLGVALPLLVLAWRGLGDMAILPGVLDLAGVSLLLALVGSLLCLAVGGGLAWLAFRARLHPGWDALLLPAYLVPPFVGALGFLYALQLVGLQPYGVGGILLAWTAHYAPIAYLLLRPALESKLAPLLVACEVHGVTGWRRVRALLPPLLPALVAAFGALYLTLLGNFGVPAVLGLPAQVYTLPTLAYARLFSPASPDPLGEAAAIGLLLGVLAVPALLLSSQPSGEPSPRPLRPRLVWAARIGFTLFALAAVVFPLVGLVRRALFNTFTGAFQPAFVTAWELPLVRQGLTNSVLLALLATGLLLLLGLLMAPQRSAMKRLRQVLDMHYLLPGTLLALGLILLLAPTPLYATPWILLLAYLLNFAALMLRSIEAGLEAGIERLVEVGKLFGLRHGWAWWKIGFPLLQPYLAAGVFLILPLCMAELTLSAMLYAPGSETLGVAVLSALNGGLFREAAAIGLMLMALSLLLLWVPRRGVA